jgi:dTMP kinase
MDPLTEALLMFAGRRDHLLEVIEPALARGDVVLCDRFTDATFAYQGFGREFDCVALQSLESLVQRTPSLPAPKIRQPDVTLWFDVDPAVAASRLAGVRVPDRFEAQPQEFFARVSKGYAWRMQQYRARFARINAEQGLEKVWQEVEAALRQRGFLP